jgi:hypothetical protein
MLKPSEIIDDGPDAAVLLTCAAHPYGHLSEPLKGVWLPSSILHAIAIRFEDLGDNVNVVALPIDGNCVSNWE